MPTNNHHNSYHPYQQQRNSDSDHQHHRQHSRNHHHHHHHHHHQRNNNYNHRGNYDEYQNNNPTMRENSNHHHQYNIPYSHSSATSQQGGRYFEQLNNNNNRHQQQYRGGNQSSSNQVRFSIPSSSSSSNSSRIEKNREPESHSAKCDICREYKQSGMMKCISCDDCYRHVDCDVARNPKSKPNSESKYINFMCENCFEVKVKIEGDDFRIFALNKVTTTPIENDLDKMDDSETSSVMCPLCNQLIAGHSREIFNNHLRFKFKDALIEKFLLTGTIPIPITSRKSGVSIEHSFKPNDFNSLSTCFFVLGFKKDQLEEYMVKNCPIEYNDIRNFLEIDRNSSICIISCWTVRGAFILACKLRCAVIETAHPMIYFIKSTRSLKVFQKICSIQEFTGLNKDIQSIKNMEITSLVSSEGKNETIVHFKDDFDCIKWMWTCHKSATTRLPKIEFHDDHLIDTTTICHIKNLPTKDITLSELWKDIKRSFKQRLTFLSNREQSKIKYYVSDWFYDVGNHIIRVEFHHSKFCELFKLLLDGLELLDVKLSITIPSSTS
ncbi:predicted protein [Naegleria gruberi]|uniref:Predicted protein n=1 Tax=Naegleria gruberi TaxID=5762 RepID=D2VTP6_NAEGR|nr:uncharacterized protein NAEGRDRAFT_52167 [Naegleria gruberi]EFC39691.1 predicted protein [Naegleria gruberi]|eukprot:XP_002672435.1 predicted protein [Naegleria gruberi strain NEG-M]